MLDPDHRTLLSELSLLPSPFTLDAAQAMTGLTHDQVVDGLAALTERSLLMHVASKGTSRYRMLETIRLFAREQLGESRAVSEERLYAYALETAGRIVDAARRADPELTVLLTDTYPIIRRALVRGTETDTDPGDCVELASALWWLEDIGHQSEAADTVARVVNRWPESDRLGPLWGVLAGLQRYAGRRSEAEEAARRAVDYPDPLGGAYGWRTLGQFARGAGNWAEARKSFEAGMEAAVEAGVTAVALEIELHLAISDARAGDIAGSIARLDSVSDRSSDLPLVQVVCTVFRAWIWLGRDVSTAEEIAGVALDVSHRIAYRWGIGSAHMTLGMVAMSRGQVTAAAGHVIEAIAEFRAIRDRTGITLAMLLASALLAGSGNETAAVAASAARHEHLSGELGAFERSLFSSIGAKLDIPAEARSLPLAALTAELEGLASGGGTAANRLVIGPAVSTVVFARSSAQLRTTKGLVDLSTLLAEPGREFAAVDLMGAVVISPDAGPGLDDEARRQYEARPRWSCSRRGRHRRAGSECGDTPDQGRHVPARRTAPGARFSSTRIGDDRALLCLSAVGPHHLGRHHRAGSNDGLSHHPSSSHDPPALPAPVRPDLTIP